MLGQDFHPGVIVLVCLKSPSDYDFPEFGEIIYVLVPDESKLLVVKRLCTDYYSQHYNAYCVTKSSNFALVDVGELAIHDVFHLYRLSSDSSQYYIVVRSCNHVEVCI